ncbi:tetrapyrrole biosynthesis, uroporphyrinogen III synthase [Wallemia mellicola]|uniref:Tetrapyrrole biosynthesis, uroporphyrinogen III synthase n=1 Tax=Wallemia mellicola TaxID=1708541 RepID=A0A4T0NNG6_9BASI|nr:tetrapyrrole biosynthesis, uroporphyrinogen III synthase [Wallemia mellicola]TIC04900.1 tetrapyrrole biosynthesis, uroporphyrinogen III synthase [Wallemia mellicola]
MRVLLFKEETSNYKDALTEGGYDTLFIPVLRSISVDIPRLRELIHKSAHDYDAVLVTSQRAVQAWKEASIGIDSPISWSNIPFYSVGPSTSNALQTLKDTINPDLAPRDVLGGEESGNGNQLAEYILSREEKPRRILYLVGDKTASELSNILQDHGVEITRLQVYATQQIASEEIETTLKQKECTDTVWSVIFSPSGANVIVPAIKNLKLDTKLASIGPTTTRRLQEMHMDVDAMPARPDARQLTEEMHKSDTVDRT